MGDFNNFNEGYNTQVPCDDFSKPGMGSADPVSADWLPVVKAISVSCKRGPNHQDCSIARLTTVLLLKLIVL
jgi:hypothetical protein